MKGFLILTVLALALGSSHVLARSRFVRETEAAEEPAAPEDHPMMASADGAAAKEHPEGEHHGGDDRIQQTVARALTTLRKHVNEELGMDVEKIQTALSSGALDETLSKVREQFKGRMANFREIVDAVQKESTGEFKEVIERVMTQAAPVIEKFQSRLEQQRQHIHEHAKSAIDVIAEALKGATN